MYVTLQGLHFTVNKHCFRYIPNADDYSLWVHTVICSLWHVQTFTEAIPPSRILQTHDTSRLY